MKVLEIYQIRLRLDPGEQSIGVRSIFVFPGYNNQTWLHDIALLEVILEF